MKIILSLLISLILVSKNFSQQPWEATNLPSSGAYFGDIDFLTPNIGFGATFGGGTLKRLFKTTNKGINWTQIWSTNSNSSNVFSISVDFISENKGFISYDDKIIKIENGNSSTVFTFPDNSSRHRIRFVDDNIGYALYSKYNDKGISIYKTTNAGSNWFVTSVNNILSSSGIQQSFCYDLDFLKSDPAKIYVVGRAKDNNSGALIQPLYIRTGDSYTSYSLFRESNTNTNHESYDEVCFLPNSDLRILGSTGIYGLPYNGNTTQLFPITNPSNPDPQFGLKFTNDEVGYAVLNNGNILRTTNGGNNWTVELQTVFFA